jgi:hypothetical protein
VKPKLAFGETDGGSQVRQDAIYKKDDPGRATGETVGIPRRLMVRAEKTWRRFDSQD